MANLPIYTGNVPLSTALSASITRAWELSLLDRTGGALLANPVLAAGYEGPMPGSLTSKLVYLAWGANKMIATNQGTDATIYTLATTSSDLVFARRAFARQVSDMGRAFDAWGIADWVNFVFDSTISWNQTVVSMLGALGPSFSATGGNTGAAATWGAVFDDYQVLSRGVSGPKVFICRPKDWGNIAKDALSVGGFIANDPETGGYKAPSYPGFKGNFLNGDLAIYTSDELPASGPDHVSIMFGAQALRWGTKMAPPSPNTTPLLWTPTYGVETDRVALKNDDIVVTSSQVGTAIGINAAGIKCPYLT